MGAAFKPNRPDVIDEVFEGEAVLVHMMAGLYYSLNSAATVVWRLLADGRSAQSIADSTGADADAIAEFIAKLQAEDLLTEAEADAGKAAEPVTLDGAPTIDRFSDMQDLLLLDPIHDIDLDGDGWPVAQAPQQ